MHADRGPMLLFALVVITIIVVIFLFPPAPVEALGSSRPPPPHPPPPPPSGVLGGPLTGLRGDQIALFTKGYFDFNVKWDSVRGLGPVFTQAGCYVCHGGGNNVISDCFFNSPLGEPCIAGGTSPLLGTRYGKFNPDGTFNNLDGTGTSPENEGGPINHGLTVATFGTLSGCSIMSIAASPTGATESGTKVTITTTKAHGLLTGDTVTISLVGVSGYNGSFTITSVPTPTTFAYTATVSGLAASGGGTATILPAEVVPADATVNNQIRSPQLFGLGLIDAIPEATILANSGVDKGLGIMGVANMVPDQNGNLHAGRLGQKASIPNLLMFTAAAFHNELSITNFFFPAEHLPQGQPVPAPCLADTNSPEDVNFANVLQAYQFNELLAPNTPAPPTSQTLAGQAVFETIGCNLCHIESMTTGSNITLTLDQSGTQSDVVAPLSNAQVNLYSDLLLHDMHHSGGIPQGQATLTMWRTAPLWGLSTRINVGLMHANQARSIDEAIRTHGGEATQVLNNYKVLNSSDLSNLLAFLGSL